MAFRDPNAPVISRLFATNTPPNERIEIDSYRTEGVTTGGQIRLYGQGWTAFQAAKVELVTEGLDPAIDSVLNIQGPNHGAGFPAQLLMYKMTNGTSEIEITADQVRISVEAWKSTGGLANGWVDFGGSAPTFQYRKYPDGDVALRGVIKSGVNVGIFTLPAGYRPPATIGWQVPISGGSARILVGDNGVVQIPVTVGSQTFTEVTGRFSTQ